MIPARQAPERVRFPSVEIPEAWFGVVRFTAASSGPTLALLAGVHACEYMAMAALRRFLDVLCTRLRGGRVILNLKFQHRESEFPCSINDLRWMLGLGF